MVQCSVYLSRPALPGITTKEEVTCNTVGDIASFCNQLILKNTTYSILKIRENRSMSKEVFLLLIKYERTFGNYMVFTVFNLNFGLGANFGRNKG